MAPIGALVAGIAGMSAGTAAVTGAALAAGGMALASASRRKTPRPFGMPSVPKPEEILDVRDEVAGEETVTVTGADGKQRRVRRQLPKTAEEEAFAKQIDDELVFAINNLKDLYAKDPASVVDFTPFIESIANINADRIKDLSQITTLTNIDEDVKIFKNMQRNLLNSEWSRINGQVEQGLADNGISDSSTANDLKARMTREQALAQQQVDVNAQNYGEDLLTKQFARNEKGYILREQARQQQEKEAQMGYTLLQQQKNDLNAFRQNAINEQLQKMQIIKGIQNDELNQMNQGKSASIALGEFGAKSSDSLNRYNSEINAINADYRNRLAHHQAQPPTFGESVGSFASGLGGYMVGKNFEDWTQSLKTPSTSSASTKATGFEESLKRLGMGVPKQRIDLNFPY